MADMGFRVTESQHARGMQGYLSGTKAERLDDLYQAYQDPEVDFLIAGIGGWNINGLLTDFDWDVVRRNPKPLVGFSDISVLQVELYAHTGVVQLHGPTVRWGLDEATEFTKKSLVAALRQEQQVIQTPDFGGFLKGEQLQGTVIAGNLVSLSTLLGTPHAPDWRGKVLCWEETEETVYRIERALTHFQNAGVWDQIAGMVIGEIDDVNEVFNGVRTPVMGMIEEHFRDYDFPIMKTQLFGHLKGVNFLTLPTGTRIEANREIVKVG